MGKVVIKTLLKGKDVEEKGTYHGVFTKEKLSFKENDVMTSITKKHDSLVLKRKTKEYEIEMPFVLNKETKGFYKILQFHKKLDLQITTNMLEWESHGIQIDYQLKIEEENLGQFHYQIEVRK